MTDEEYTESMMFKDGKPSAFCKCCSLLTFGTKLTTIDHSYVKDIQQKICQNAAAEYSW